MPARTKMPEKKSGGGKVLFVLMLRATPPAAMGTPVNYFNNSIYIRPRKNLTL
jgi:hypothetical protein